MRAVLDTSVLIAADSPGDLEGAISAASLAELHFGVLVTADDDERARRALRLRGLAARVESLPNAPAGPRQWGRLAATVRSRGGQPRRRALDLAIAATANVHNVPLLTHNTADLQIISDLVDLHAP